mmetsp:Transcript_23925/g.42586  ORF Transcript_23925/g.42586 Transcript_23925/m.42586 type:complete len:233 (-) Transcript_23925:991-1689(-)
MDCSSSKPIHRLAGSKSIGIVVVVLARTRLAMLRVRGRNGTGQLRRSWHMHRRIRVLHSVFRRLGGLLLGRWGICVGLLRPGPLLTRLLFIAIQVQQVIGAFLHANDGDALGLIPVLVIIVRLAIGQVDVREFGGDLNERECQLFRRILNPKSRLDTVIRKIPTDLPQVSQLLLVKMLKRLYLAKEMLRWHVRLKIKADDVEQCPLCLEDLHFQGAIVLLMIHEDLLHILLR